VWLGSREPVEIRALSAKERPEGIIAFFEAHGSSLMVDLQELWQKNSEISR
jgi:hypothetical protein